MWPVNFCSAFLFLFFWDFSAVEWELIFRENRGHGKVLNNFQDFLREGSLEDGGGAGVSMGMVVL